MSFVIPVAQDKSHAKEATALQGLDRFEVGWSLARLPPFLVFCTSCPGRRFSSSCRLAYGFTPRGRCCYQPLHRRFGVTRKPTGALRSWLSVLPGIRHSTQGGVPSRASSQSPVPTGLSPDQQAPLMELGHSSTVCDPGKYRRIGLAIPLRRSMRP
jgi:hypothetical protein